MISERILHEDNHVIVINKMASEIVQGDKTGDQTMPDEIKAYLKEKYQKPGNVFCGVVHRLDRPTSGALVFARTSKALERLNAQFREKETNKIYWAIVETAPEKPSYPVNASVSGSKEAILSYRKLASGDRYHLLEITLETGRHHQIRVQLSSIGCIIKGDVKYGAKRSNPDGSICLHARFLKFTHPTSKEDVSVVAPVPSDRLWQEITKGL